MRLGGRRSRVLGVLATPSVPAVKYGPPLVISSVAYGAQQPDDPNLCSSTLHTAWRRRFLDADADERAPDRSETIPPELKASERIAEWLSDQGVAAVASDTVGVQALSPNPAALRLALFPFPGDAARPVLGAGGAQRTAALGTARTPFGLVPAQPLGGLGSLPGRSRSDRNQPTTLSEARLFLSSDSLSCWSASTSIEYPQSEQPAGTSVRSCTDPPAGMAGVWTGRTSPELKLAAAVDGAASPLPRFRTVATSWFPSRWRSEGVRSGGCGRWGAWPVRASVAGLPGAPWSISRVAVWVPGADGRNATRIGQLSPGATGPAVHAVPSKRNASRSAPSSRRPLTASPPTARKPPWSDAPLPPPTRTPWWRHWVPSGQRCPPHLDRAAPPRS